MTAQDMRIDSLTEMMNNRSHEMEAFYNEINSIVTYVQVSIRQSECN